MKILFNIATHRHLLVAMVKREVGARFAGSSLGGLWTLINPLIMLGLYSLVFAYIYRVPKPEGGAGFIEFAFCGLWPWLAFQEACLRSVTAITDNANLVKKLQFPSELLVLAIIFSSFLVQGVGFLLFLLGLMVWKGSLSLLHVGLLLGPLTIHILLAVGIGMILACGNVFFRDVSQLAGAAFTVWFFLTPILYPLSFVPASLRPFLSWNPLTSITDFYRSLVLSLQGPHWSSAFYPLVIALVLFWLGQWGFERSKGYFADYL